MLISSSQQLIDHVLKSSPKKVTEIKKRFAPQKHVIKSVVFKDFTFTKDLTDISLQKCRFVDCEFENLWGFFLVFGNCSFENCSFKNSRISHLELHWNDLEFKDCIFRNIQIDEGCIYNINFNKCQFYNFALLDMNPMESIYFNECYMENSQFKYLCYYQKGDKIERNFVDLQFLDCQIEGTIFTNVDFRNSFFRDTVLLQAAFVDCKFTPKSIQKTKKLKHESYASIDFQSILKSEFDSNVLKEIFNINDPMIKETINKITTKVDYQRVFISFSFKDIKFAERLHKELTASGVICFFWVKDAPAGDPLEEIMTSNIKANEKILFIASESSIRSQACQFELTQGRKKQEEIWESVLFPIHIDNYLFEVQKHKIRPVDKGDEYWQNIEELKKVNSADFKQFNAERIDSKKFKMAVAKIVKQLALKP